MDLNASYIIDNFLSEKQDIFTVDEFYRYLKSKNVKVSKEYASEILNSSDLVFTLVNNEYITRAGVFLGRWFSFKPTREEVKKGHILLGHRCMPFINPEIAPDKINVANKNFIVSSEPTSFSMNLAMDLFALYGEGYVIPYIFNDQANTKVPLVSVKYSMPSEITLTSWSLEKICGDYQFKYGDRLLGRVTNWEQNLVELTVIPAESDSMVISQDDIEREEWYSKFENGLLESIQKNGPGSSIEEQLAFLFLENQEELCIKNCGSAEEFLKHTKKIGFCPYGVETRIWKTGEAVPFIGEWNKDCSPESIFSSMFMIFSPQLIDAYLENYLYESQKKKNVPEFAELIDEMFPKILKMSISEKKVITGNIEKRFDILKKTYDFFEDKRLAPVRGRIIRLFGKVNELLCGIACSGVELETYPQQELVILVQLFSHIVRITEEMENPFLRAQFPVDDVSLSLEGMEDTFDDVGDTLRHSLDENTYKAITLVDDENLIK